MPAARRSASRCRSRASTSRYAGAPVDNKQYGEARRALMQQIAARQQELMRAAEEADGGAAEGRSGGGPGTSGEESKSDRQTAHPWEAVRIRGRPSCLCESDQASSVRLLQEQRAIVAVLLEREQLADLRMAQRLPRRRRAAGSARRRRRRTRCARSRPAGDRTAGPCAGAPRRGSTATIPRCC